MVFHLTTNIGWSNVIGCKNQWPVWKSFLKKMKIFHNRSCALFPVISFSHSNIQMNSGDSIDLPHTNRTTMRNCLCVITTLNDRKKGKISRQSRIKESLLDMRKIVLFLCILNTMKNMPNKKSRMTVLKNSLLHCL